MVEDARVLSPAELEEEFLKQVLEFETAESSTLLQWLENAGVEVPPPDQLDERGPGLPGQRLVAFAHLDAHALAATSSLKMRSLSASDRWHADAWCPSAGSSGGTSCLHTSIT